MKSLPEIEKEVNNSHKMGNWECDIVCIISTPRFGQLRECKKCGSQQQVSVSGYKTDSDLKEECMG